MSLVSRLWPRGPSGYGYGSTAEAVTAGLELRGKTYLLTGATSGIGLESARVLALRGARVLATGRTTAKVEAACAGFGPNLEPLALELAEPASVRALVARLVAQGTVLHGVLCNAGVMALPRRELRHGVELQLFTNHVGHFMLVTGLLPLLSEDARVVMTSSSAHARAPAAGLDLDDLAAARGYSPWQAYGQSKLANLLFAKELARRFAGTHRTANAVHPGVISTPLKRHLGPTIGGLWALASPIFMKSPAEGAATQLYVAVHPGAAGVSGAYWADCNLARPSARGEDAALAGALWAATEAIVARLP